MLCATVRHTFIEVSMGTDHRRHARSQSCPPRIVTVRFDKNREGVDQNSTWVYLWQEQASIIGWTLAGTTASTHKGEQSQSEENMCNSNAGHDKKRKLRPCKGKRLRFKKFVARLQAQIDSEVEFFDMTEVVWPPSLEANRTRRQQLVQRMEQYQIQALYRKQSQAIRH